MARTTLVTVLLAAALFAASPALAAPGPATVDPAESARALHILERSVAFKTVQGNGQVPAYADYLKSVLVAAGYAPSDVVFDRLGETGTLTATWPDLAKHLRDNQGKLRSFVNVYLGDEDIRHLRGEDTPVGGQAITIVPSIAGGQDGLVTRGQHLDLLGEAIGAQRGDQLLLGVSRQVVDPVVAERDPDARR